MNELQLSNDLTTIETEIKSYQNIAGQSIFEIGRRLKHVKENDLVHGEFGKWLESVNLNQSTANKMMKVSSELNSYTYTNLGLNALDMIATLPETERAKQHTTSTGQTKTPDEMTVKELRELKKQIKQQEEQNKQYEEMLRKSDDEKSQLEMDLQREREKEIEYREVLPEKVKRKLEKLENDSKLLEQREQENKKMRKQIHEQKQKIIENQNNTSDNFTDDEKISSKRLMAETNLLEIKEYTDEFLNNVSINAFRDAAIANSSDRTKDMIYECSEDVIKWARTMQSKLQSNNIIDID